MKRENVSTHVRTPTHTILTTNTSPSSPINMFAAELPFKMKEIPMRRLEFDDRFQEEREAGKRTY